MFHQHVSDIDSCHLKIKSVGFWVLKNVLQKCFESWKMFLNLYNHLSIMWRCLMAQIALPVIEMTENLTEKPLIFCKNTCDGRIRRKKYLGTFWKAVFLPWLCLRWYHKIISKAWKWQRHLIYMSALMIWFNPLCYITNKSRSKKLYYSN